MDAMDASNPVTGMLGELAGGESSIARLFDMTSELLATISLDGRFTLVNAAWERVLGWTPAELISRPIDDFLHPDDALRTLELMRSANGAGQLEPLTNRCRHKDGSWRWLAWSSRSDGTSWYAA